MIILSFVPPSLVKANDIYSTQEIVKQIFTYIKNKQWDEFVNSYYSNEKITMEQYFHDAANTDGV